MKTLIATLLACVNSPAYAKKPQQSHSSIEQYARSIDAGLENSIRLRNSCPDVFDEPRDIANCQNEVADDLEWFRQEARNIRMYKANPEGLAYQAWLKKKGR